MGLIMLSFYLVSQVGASHRVDSPQVDCENAKASEYAKASESQDYESEGRSII